MNINVNWDKAFKIFVGTTAVVFWVLLILSTILSITTPDSNEELRQYVKQEVQRVSDFVNAESARNTDFVNKENQKTQDWIDNYFKQYNQ